MTQTQAKREEKPQKWLDLNLKSWAQKLTFLKKFLIFLPI